ncbi:MAG: hypothetical protein QXT86_13805 [Archaeoglobaceae archaeon]
MTEIKYVEKRYLNRKCVHEEFLTNEFPFIAYIRTKRVPSEEGLVNVEVNITAKMDSSLILSFSDLLAYEVSLLAVNATENNEINKIVRIIKKELMEYYNNQIKEIIVKKNVSPDLSWEITVVVY